MTTPQKYDAIIIGASTAAGTRLMPSLAQAGWRTAVIEREHLGGTCVNVGCMPTKNMVASALGPATASPPPRGGGPTRVPGTDYRRFPG